MAGSISGVLINERGQDHDFTLFKGSTVSFAIVWGGVASPIDVTGFDAKLVARTGPNEAASFEFLTSNSRVQIGDTDGVITFTMTKTDSAALTLGDYIYNIEVTDSGGNDIPVMSGKFKVVTGAG